MGNSEICIISKILGDINITLEPKHEGELKLSIQNYYVVYTDYIKALKFLSDLYIVMNLYSGIKKVSNFFKGTSGAVNKKFNYEILNVDSDPRHYYISISIDENTFGRSITKDTMLLTSVTLKNLFADLLKFAVENGYISETEDITIENISFNLTEFSAEDINND